MDIREILIDAGYNVVGEVSDGFDAVEICRKQKPDMVLLDIRMPLLDGLKAARLIYEEGLADAILILTAYSNKELVDEAKENGVAGYVVKPIREEALIPMVEIGIAKGKERIRMKREVFKTRQRLEDRALIEKAKGLLMKQNKISEQEAFEMIRKNGMNKRRPMRDIAKIILLNQ